MEKQVYEKMFAREDKFWWHLGMKKIIDGLLNQYASGRSDNIILDAGCGTGGFFAVLAKYGKVYGIDGSAEAVFYARQRNLAEVLKERVEQLPFADNFFDVILCHDVLYHRTVDDKAAVKEFFRVLKPGGILLVKEASFNWLMSSHDKLVWTKHRYSRAELKRLLAGRGFSILKASYLVFSLFPMAVLARLGERFLSQKIDSEKLFISSANSFLKYFLYLEAKLLKYINFPFGLSVVCLAKKRS